MTKEKQVFKTHDIGLAAALITYGFKLIEVDNTVREKSQFIFDPFLNKVNDDGFYDEDIESESEAYWFNTLRVPARSYFENLKMLKNRIYSN